MPVYDSTIDRDDAAALIPEDAAREILGTVSEQSVVMNLAASGRLPDMSRKQRRLPMWSSLPIAYFVSGDSGLKQTTSVSWENVYLNAEELAVICPIPENVLDDVDYDIWTQVRPTITSAIGKAFDQAVLYGINAPTDWPDSIKQGAINAGQVIEEGDIGDLYDDILGEGGVVAKVEEDGYAVNGHAAALAMRAKFRGLRDNEGRPIFLADPLNTGKYMLDGETLAFPRNGALDPDRSLLISGDWSQLKWAIRRDLTWKVLTEAVIQDGSGNIVYNLAQQDMVALRVVFRAGWVLPNPINLVNDDASTRYPFAVYAPQASS